VSFALDAPVRFGIDGEVDDVLISELQMGEGVRSGGLDESHVDLLMESAEAWPPIVVWGDRSLVIDGFHRVEAARRLGRRSVAAIRFVGSAEEAFMESVRRNVNHGLPLTVGDRRRAARRILTRNPEWSDRRIASLCGLSDKTVGRLRRAASGIQVIDRRVGRDGKVRPVQAGQVRARVRQALEENPGGSLRAIAAVAGASPETVRSVRAGLLAPGGQSAGGETPTSCRRTDGPALSLLTLLQPTREETVPSDRNDLDWLTDRAFSGCSDGGEFARWFASNSVTEDWHRFVWTVPLGRVYDVVDEARRRAASWTSFASLLESRTR
jgi:ParB-like chromosome segregation protein Spo0J